MANAVEPTAKKTEIAVFREQLETMGPQFQKALPAHIPLERFERVVMTAVQNNPDLVIKCSRSSLFNACVKAAQDGLLPDGREGAIVPYGSDAQWLPMVFGIRKKVRNSGDIVDWDVQLVYENDGFEHELGTEKFIRHKRAMGPRGEPIGGYSIANLKDGGVSIEIMSIHEIEAVRKQSSRAKSDKSPWNVLAYYPEMCRKTIAKRHSKTLPMSSDLDDLIRRDDDLYDMEGAAVEARPRRRQLGAALDQLAGGDEGQQSAGEQVDGKTGEVTGGETTQGESGGGKPAAESEDPKPPTDTKATEGKTTNGKPVADKKSDKPKEPEPPKEPTTEREWEVYAKAWIDKAVTDRDEQTLNNRWNSADEKKVRGHCNVSPEKREEVFEYLTAARGKLAK